ncbi:hypothetical protein GQ457_09G021880 [Hibiscus cannabinus]
MNDLRSQTHNSAGRTDPPSVSDYPVAFYVLALLKKFAAANKPTDGKRFLRILSKRQELAERVMVTRLHLYAKWIKKCDHAEIYREISDENLELMRERLMQTVASKEGVELNDGLFFLQTEKGGLRKMMDGEEEEEGG